MRNMKLEKTSSSTLLMITNTCVVQLTSSLPTCSGQLHCWRWVCTQLAVWWVLDRVPGMCC